MLNGAQGKGYSVKSAKNYFGSAAINVPYRLVLIIWEDSQLGYQGWKMADEADKPKVPNYVSTGFLVYEDKYCKVLYPHLKDVSDKESLAGTGDIVIPTSAIKKIIELTAISS